MDIVLSQPELHQINSILEASLLQSGADCALLVNRAGYLVATQGDPSHLDATTLAALSAVNFGATVEIARIIGEDDFALTFHKGKNENLHYAKIGEDFFLVTLFSKDVSLGLIRLKTTTAADQLRVLLNEGE
jgi:predicted regulator of Ras-like GTPase activity (Roadblock/LC7/MglB family)